MHMPSTVRVTLQFGRGSGGPPRLFQQRCSKELIKSRERFTNDGYPPFRTIRLNRTGSGRCVHVAFLPLEPGRVGDD
jgi:hypothetical protein